MPLYVHSIGLVAPLQAQGASLEEKESTGKVKLCREARVQSSVVDLVFSCPRRQCNASPWSLSLTAHCKLRWLGEVEYNRDGG